MALIVDGPASPLFQPIPLKSGRKLESLRDEPVSDELKARLQDAPQGSCVCWGIPFSIEEIVLVRDAPVSTPLPRGVKARWLVFMHTMDLRPLEANAHGLYSPMRGEGGLGELACTCLIRNADGAETSVPLRKRHHVGCFTKRWGENCFEAVSHRKPSPVRASHEQLRPGWGESQTRVYSGDGGSWLCWLWAWENPLPEVPLESIRFEPTSGTMILFGVTAGSVASHPLRWETRRKALLTLAKGSEFSFNLDDAGLLKDVSLDLGQVISARPRPVYPEEAWEAGYNNQVPEVAEGQVLLEYTAHPQAYFHLSGGTTVPVSELRETPGAGPLASVAPSRRRVRLKVVEKGSGKPVAVKLHAHGKAGEYLAPVDRHRIPNPAWFEDYSVDFVHRGAHWCTYIPGETTLDLPIGPVFLEIAKGFEVRPVRRRFEIGPSTEEIVVELDRVLRWRERGWVTADTHVHFLSPVSALLEGCAEGVNVVNLLASQWGELMTNVGDFDGRTTWGSREAGGDGEYLVRVGTENRQHILGHISLLGYGGGIIAPMTTGGADESAIGDPVEILLSEWAEVCKAKGGLVILPHFPNPRAEHAAAVVGGKVDGVEMTSWGELYAGISPYSLSDWYRYLNCGYPTAAVGGTDKMSADTAVGTVRTYARIPEGRPFTYDEWKEAVRRAETFVTYGPLIEFSVDGRPMGSRVSVPGSGGSFEAVWRAESVTVPMSRIELVVNGEIRHSVQVDAERAEGHWTVRIDRSSWAALLVRGKYPDRPEMIAAHSSPVMISVGEGPFFAAADALTILEQIEGAMVFLDVIGTRADAAAYKRMRLVLESAHRSVHNRLHQEGHYHKHTGPQDHGEHHR